MRKPSIHLNGTSAQALFDGYRNALNKAQEAQEALRECAPHGRDYYVQDGDAINEAIAEHRARFVALDTIINDMETLALHVMETSGGKVKA